MKIVKEHINEKFTEEGDPIHDMGIGYDVTTPEGYLKSRGYDIVKYEDNRVEFDYGPTSYVLIEFEKNGVSFRYRVKYWWWKGEINTYFNTKTAKGY